MAQKNATNIKSKSPKAAVAAIDFGTTYSGFAFSWKHDWSKVQVISNHSADFMSRKVPTSLLLKPDKSFYAFGSEAEMIYTQMAEKNKSDSDSDSDLEDNGEKEEAESRICSDYYYFNRFKMLLHDNKNLHRNSVIKDITGKKMRAMDIFSISIKHLKDTLIQTMNSRLAEGVFSENDIDFVLTVPAIWGDEAKLFMREAAIQAGIKTSQLTLALEPEAASIYCQHMHLINTNGPPNVDETFKTVVEEGKKYMVVDLGGGTADITVHKQTADGTLEEMLPATGGPLGGTSVDDEYVKLLDTIGGKGILEAFSKISMEDYLSILKEFEAKKREVSDSLVRIKIPVKFADSIRKRITGGLQKALQNSIYKNSITYKNYKLCLQLSEFEKLFQNTINGIIKCVADILSNKDFDDVKDIIMVGGFSDCKLIQRALKEKFTTRHFIIPDEAGLAVLKGAVFFGHLPNAISRRAARYTYGVQICRKFKPGEDPEDKKTYSGWN